MTTLTMKVPTTEELKKLTLKELAGRAGFDLEKRVPEVVTIIWVMPDEEANAFGIWEGRVDWKGKTTKKVIDELRKKVWGERFYK